MTRSKKTENGDKDYSEIFKPISINGTEIKNRIVMSPMNCNMTDPDHYISRQQMAWYGARAKGGVGLVITEATAVSTQPYADTYRKYNNPYLTDYRYVALQSELVEHVHAFGAKIFVQLFTGPGRQGTDDCGAVQPVAPSPIPLQIQPNKLITGVVPREGEPSVMGSGLRMRGYHGRLPEDPDELQTLMNKFHPAMGQTPREITIEELKTLSKDLGKGATYARYAGYDGVEIHACHGYLGHAFLCDRSNLRRDEYGGSFENRIRFMVEQLRSVRKICGPDYPVGVRMSASDDLPGGFDPHFAARVAKRLEEEGADFINLSDGSFEALSDFLPNKEGQVIDKAAIIKEAVSIPVICPSVHDPDNVVQALKNGKADMISQGRQLIADPEWVNKVKAGKIKEIVRCIRCNEGCLLRFTLTLPARCILNPNAGQEQFIDEYMKRPILPFKKRGWLQYKDYRTKMGKEPSKYYEYTDEEIKNL